MSDLDKIFGPNKHVNNSEVNFSYFILGIGILLSGIYFGKKITEERKNMINNSTKK
jgi:hypothetical protein